MRGAGTAAWTAGAALAAGIAGWAASDGAARADGAAGADGGWPAVSIAVTAGDGTHARSWEAVAGLRPPWARGGTTVALRRTDGGAEAPPRAAAFVVARSRTEAAGGSGPSTAVTVHVAVVPAGGEGGPGSPLEDPAATHWIVAADLADGRTRRMALPAPAGGGEAVEMAVTALPPGTPVRGEAGRRVP